MASSSWRESFAGEDGPTDPDGGAVYVTPIVVCTTPEPRENMPLSFVQLHFPDV